MFYLKQGIGIFFLVVAICSGPLILQTVREEVVFAPENMVAPTLHLLEELAGGSLGDYYVGDTKRSIAADILPFAENSFNLLFVSTLLAVAASLLFGLFLQRFRIVRRLQGVLGFISTVPDFIFVFLSVLAAVSFYKWTNIRIITLSPTSESANHWFPILILAIGLMCIIVLSLIVYSLIRLILHLLERTVLYK